MPAAAPDDTSGAVAALGTILSVWAHPDDETYLAGGIMAAATENGQRVVCVSATAGELGTPDPQTWPPERMGRLRRWEAAGSMAILGVSDHRFLDLPDGGLAALDPSGPVARIASLLEEVRPDTVLTFAPHGTTFHPDHQAVSAWTTQAWREAGSPGRLLHQALSEEDLARWGPMFEQWNVYMTDERPEAVPASRLALDVRLDGAVLDQKVAALCAMYSQTGPSLAMIGEDVFRQITATETYVAVPS
jgi:LmbE family N-acetylglucosaminyl deacetylase